VAEQKDILQQVAEDGLDRWIIWLIDTGISQTPTILQTIDRLLNKGRSPDEVLKLLTADLKTNPFFGSFIREIKKNGEAGIKRLIDDMQQQSVWGDPEKLQWQAVLDERTCPDCVARHGLVKTRTEWEVLGEPTWGGTVCGIHCRCKLVPVGRATKEPVRVPRRRRKKK